MFSFSGDNARAGEGLNSGTRPFRKNTAIRLPAQGRTDPPRHGPDESDTAKPHRARTDHQRPRRSDYGIAYRPKPSPSVCFDRGEDAVFIVIQRHQHRKDGDNAATEQLSRKLTSRSRSSAYTHKRSTFTRRSRIIRTGIDAGESITKALYRAPRKDTGDVRPAVRERFHPYIQRVKDANPKPDACSRSFRPDRVGPVHAHLERDGAHAKGITLIGEGGLVGEDDLLAIRGCGPRADHVVPLFRRSIRGVHVALNERFVKDYLAVSGQGIRPDYAAVAGYDTLAAIYKVVELQKGKVDPDRTMALLRGMTLDSPRGPIMIDPKTRDIDQNIYIRADGAQGWPHGEHRARTYKMVKDPLENY